MNIYNGFKRQLFRDVLKEMYKNVYLILKIHTFCIQKILKTMFIFVIVNFCINTRTTGQNKLIVSYL